jgi:iron(III) transport system substrate-binding protein
LLLLNACQTKTGSSSEIKPDLVVFTSAGESIYKPIIKEFMERTGLSVKVITGSSTDLAGRIQSGTLSDTIDVVFAIDSVMLELNRTAWLPYHVETAVFDSNPEIVNDGAWTPLYHLPVVILYNKRLVTSGEVPTGFESLLSEQWKGKIAFISPNNSEISAYALLISNNIIGNIGEYTKKLIENIEYQTYTSNQTLNTSIITGHKYMGISSEDNAYSLTKNNPDIDYIYPDEGTFVITYGSAISNGCANPGAAKSFIDFISSEDAALFLSDNNHLRPARTDISAPDGLRPLSELRRFTLPFNEIMKQYKIMLIGWDNHLNTNIPER